MCALFTDMPLLLKLWIAIGGVVLAVVFGSPIIALAKGEPLSHWSITLASNAILMFAGYIAGSILAGLGYMFLYL